VMSVDLGTLVSYTVFADNVLLWYGSVEDFSRITIVLDEVADSINPRKVIIKAGVTSTGLRESFLRGLWSV